MTLSWRERRTKEAGKASEQRVLDALIDLRHELGDEREPMIKEIAERANVNAHTASGVMSRLHEMGAVMREGTRHDGAWVPLRLEAYPVAPVTREVSFE